MEATARLAGFFAAHAIWCVSDAESLIPILAYETGDQQREMVRLIDEETSETQLETGRAWVEKNPDNVPSAVIAYDGYVEIDGDRSVAIVLEATDAESETSSFVIAVPYRPLDSPEGFAVHRPKFLRYEGEAPDYESLGEAFFAGVEEHAQGAEIWAEHMDESR